MRLWINSDEAPEGKYLVVRRDGSIPAWPHFVMGARDPAVPVALRAYADEAERLGYDPEMVADTRALSHSFESYCLTAGEGDPDAKPHRKDDPRVIDKMQFGGHIYEPD